MSEGSDAPFERSDAFFKHVGGGVHDTGVNVAEFFETK
jgi:hypothetical protein